MDAIRVIDDDVINIYMNNSKSPCIIKDDEESYNYLILPMSITEAL
jgi:DNA polymerase-3 subunit beta